MESWPVPGRVFEGLSDVILELVSDFALYTSRSRELALEFSWAACAAKWENHLLALPERVDLPLRLTRLVLRPGMLC